MMIRVLPAVFWGLVLAGGPPAPPEPAPTAIIQPERLVVIKETHLPDVPKMYVAPGMFRAWRARAASFESLAALTPETYNLTTFADPLRVTAGLVTVNLFATLRVRPALGRDFAAGEDEPGKADVVLLGHAFWRAHFDGRADALGQTLIFDGRSVKIVGIMPPGLEGPFAADVYRPLAYTKDTWESYSGHVIATVVGRLKPGTSLAEAETEVVGISTKLGTIDGGIRSRWGARVIPLAEQLAALAGPRVTPRGFDPNGVSTVSMTLDPLLNRTAKASIAFTRALVEAVSKLPGVTAVGGASALPLSGDEWINGFEIDDVPVPPTFPLGTNYVVTDGYFAAMRIPLLRGRFFDPSDTALPVAIISERAAKRFPAGVDPLNQYIRPYGGKRWLHIVGIVGEVSAGQYGRIEGQIYQPYAQDPPRKLSLVIRSQGDPGRLAAGVRDAIRAHEPAQAASALGPYSAAIAERVAPR
jgi:hypothetical protein